MEIIKNPIKEVNEILGTQEYDPSMTYRKSYYTICLKVKNGILVYHSLLGSVILCKEFNDTAFFVANWYYVPNGFDERRLVQKVRERLQSDSIFNSLKTFTIYPTTDCNAKCHYCFENGRKKNKMAEQTAFMASRYIINNSNQNKITIRWFGGEPLYNQTAIKTICNDLQIHGVDFESKMATNGFLFNSTLIKTAKTDWKLKQVQITLDGTEDIYNVVKGFTTKVNAFKKVIKNIHLLSEQSIHVVIRLNVDKISIDNQKELVENTLISEFEGNKYVSIYTHLLMEALRKYDKTEMHQLFKLKKEIDRIIFRHGLSIHTATPTNPKLYKCIADNRESVTILPDGKIGLCEHYTDDKYISDLNTSESFDFNQISEIRTYNTELVLCKKCQFYPRCVRLINCPDSGICNLEIKRQNINYIKDEMASEYHKWLLQKNKS